MDFVVSMMLPRAKERGLNLQLHTRGIERELITTDSLRLNQILINLLSNAVKFSHEGGDIGLFVEKTASDGEWGVYQFEVRDQGIGIDPRTAARLFQPFEQADTSISRTYGGTGLGLVIAKGLVEMMGGAISLESEQGRGSTFQFTIRAKFRLAEAGSVAMPDAPSDCRTIRDFNGKRALVVDDIDINREILFELLQDTGLAMDFAENGRIAVDMFQNSPPGYYDIILMDMQMPIMDGCTATERIRALSRPDSPSVTIVAMTANVMKEDVDKALASGMNGHLGKPIVLEKVLDAIAGASSGIRTV